MRFFAEFHIAADPADARDLRRQVRQRLEPIGLRGADLDRLVLVLDELVGNAVEHGSVYRSQGDVLSVRVLVARSGGVDVEFHDPAAPEDVTDDIRRQIAHHDNGKKQPPVHNERGRGLFLIADAFDSVEVQRGPDGHGLLLRGKLRRGPA